MTRNEKNEITERATRRLNETDFEVEIDDNEEWFTDFKASFNRFKMENLHKHSVLINVRSAAIEQL